MKDQLIKWGFVSVTYDDTAFLLANGSTHVGVLISRDGKIESVSLHIANSGPVTVPNCNNELALINLLYILGLLEV